MGLSPERPAGSLIKAGKAPVQAVLHKVRETSNLHKHYQYHLVLVKPFTNSGYLLNVFI